jgi:hypothetical protein
VQALERRFPNTRYRIQARHWTLDELRALERTAFRYRNVLGRRRAASHRRRIRKTLQNVRTVSALNYAPDDNGRDPDSSTHAETFRNAQNISFFSRNSARSRHEIQRTSDHEMAHSELQPHFLTEFERQRGGFTDEFGRNERPVSTYGSTNSREDFAETFAHTIIAPQRVRREHPGRYNFARGIFESL